MSHRASEVRQLEVLTRLAELISDEFAEKHLLSQVSGFDASIVLLVYVGLGKLPKLLFIANSSQPASAKQ